MIEVKVNNEMVDRAMRDLKRKLKKMLEDEAFMPASEAVELGLADRIIS